MKGRADMSRLAFIGHSQGGEGAYWLTQKAGLDAPDAFADLGYGPVYGLLMIAPSANWGGARGARLPLAVILPACDNDVINQEGSSSMKLAGSTRIKARGLRPSGWSAPTITISIVHCRMKR